MNLLDKLLMLFEYETQQAWAEALFEIATQSGFDHLLYGVVLTRTTPFEAAFIKSNYPEAWRAAYDQQSFHYIDPIVSHCLVSAVPMIWSGETFRSQVEKDFYEQARAHGLYSGISYPIHGVAGEFGMLSFTSSEHRHAAFSKDYEAMTRLSLVRDYALESSIKFVHQRDDAPVTKTRLTPRELECVKWVMAGKSSWEISQILHCSEATINFHVANLKKKFNVPTRQQVVVKAIKERLILPA